MDIRPSHVLLTLIAAAGLGLAACGQAPAYGDLARPAAPATEKPEPWDAELADLGDDDGRATDPPTTSPTPTPTKSPTRSPTPTPTPTDGPDSSSPTPTETDDPPDDDPPEDDPPDDDEPTEDDDPPEEEGSDPPSDPDNLRELEDRVIELTNAERDAKGGCDQPLRADDRLREAARAHSADMAERDYLDHVNPEGDGPGERAAAAGYESWSGENIAMGYSTAEEVVAGWMDSEGHRKNILNCDSKAIGVGAADSSRGMYWTQLFGYE